VISGIRKFKSENSMSLAEPLRYVTIDSKQVKPVLKDIQKTMRIGNIKIGKAKGKRTETFKIGLDVTK